MQLQPKRPPGRVDRKAGAYAAEILRMRAEGYTYAAILEALQDVGITTTEASLRREVRRPQKRPSLEEAFHQNGPDVVPRPTERPDAGVRGPGPAIAAGPRGRRVAEAFFAAHPSNPLFRSEEAS
ncbi:hypothetical protein [Piscinibacter sp. HJYY11]|uniref:hypothetical protein n=1 Tax=Piscinibacter sp. HJYY11 TaxID=2801333 RepID=UPI00191D7C83|nr:hypothetical protein [Piscinibacter sp. HJYY11]MBL0726099.1 hypothetical protein [Piscinibacter sp. HJYY11]